MNCILPTTGNWLERYRSLAFDLDNQRHAHPSSQLKRAERAIQMRLDQAELLTPEKANALQGIVDVMRTIEGRFSTATDICTALRR
jgi:hypothetical protein